MAEADKNCQDGKDKMTVLLSMHQFYAEEARHQRTMMWETIKWFTPILLAIHYAWSWIYFLYIGKEINNNPKLLPFLIFIPIGAIGLCLELMSNVVYEKIRRRYEFPRYHQ